MPNDGNVRTWDRGVAPIGDTGARCDWYRWFKGEREARRGGDAALTEDAGREAECLSLSVRVMTSSDSSGGTRDDPCGDCGMGGAKREAMECVWWAQRFRFFVEYSSKERLLPSTKGVREESSQSAKARWRRRGDQRRFAVPRSYGSSSGALNTQAIFRAAAISAS